MVIPQRVPPALGDCHGGAGVGGDLGPQQEQPLHQRRAPRPHSGLHPQPRPLQLLPQPHRLLRELEQGDQVQAGGEVRMLGDFKEGGQRNWLQVLCNGGMALELSLLYLLDLGSADLPVDFRLVSDIQHYAVLQLL